MKIVVTKSHTREFEHPILLSIGDKVQIDRNRGKHWLGDIYCTLPNGDSGWAYSQAFGNQVGNEIIVSQEYSSQELNVEVGEILEGYGDDGWCMNAEGKFGWIPDNCFEVDKEDLRYRQSALIAEIELAFANVTKGKDGIGLRESIQRDATYAHNDETLKLILDAKAQDVESWQELSDSLLEKYFGALNWIWTDPPGFRYLMPAYMRFSLRKISENTHFAEDTVHRILERFPDWIIRLDLTVSQTRATARFCELLLDMWIISWLESAHWQRELTHALFQMIDENLSPGWFNHPV
jgi:hypothetical protein